MKRRTLVLIWSFWLLFTIALQAQPNDKLTVDLFLEWESVSNPQLSPDGKQIVYTKRWTDKVNDKYSSEIWIMNIDGSKDRFLLKGASPKWSPDGQRLLYTAKGEPTGSQIYVRWMDSSESSQLTRLENSPSNIQWSPDGKKIAFNMIGPAEKSWRVKMPKKPRGAKWSQPARVIDRLNYRRDGRGYNADGFRHIYVIPSSGGTPRQVTFGDFNDGAPKWTADGKGLVFSGLREPEWDWQWRESEIYLVTLEEGAITALTDREGPDYNPVVSPGGKMIAYTGYDRTDDTYIVSQLYVMNLDGSHKRSLTAELDRRPSSVQWAADGSGLFFTYQDRGARNLHFVSLKSGKIIQVTRGSHYISSPFIGKKGQIAAVLAGYHQPGDLVTFSRKHPTPKQLTAVNDDLLEDRKLGEVEEIWYDSAEGVRIQGWIVKPPDFDAQKKYPLILYIHGGPHAMYSVRFNFEFQNHAANGFVVLYTNPRGSSGYGQAFGNAIKNNYPGPDYIDLMKGVDEILKRGYIDESQLFVCGGSGGGVLTSWIVGHTERFAAAVVMKPVTNWFSFVGTTDGSSWYYNFKKLPWEDPAEHLRRSSLMYVGNVKTPTLLLTGEKDLRTPMEQTEQYYRALKLRKIETAMVRIADEFHGIGRRHPTSKIQQILYLRGWFEKYLTGEAVTAK
ncbi:MAG: prolyl oligopeptidase family serine peptidase [bacterium]